MSPPAISRFVAPQRRRALPIDNGTARDPSAAPLAIVEALVLLVTERDWPKARRRMESRDAISIGRTDRE